MAWLGSCGVRIDDPARTGCGDFAFVAVAAGVIDDALAPGAGFYFSIARSVVARGYIFPIYCGSESDFVFHFSVF